MAVNWLGLLCFGLTRKRVWCIIRIGGRARYIIRKGVLRGYNKEEGVCGRACVRLEGEVTWA